MGLPGAVALMLMKPVARAQIGFRAAGAFDGSVALPAANCKVTGCKGGNGFGAGGNGGGRAMAGCADAGWGGGGAWAVLPGARIIATAVGAGGRRWKTNRLAKCRTTAWEAGAGTATSGEMPASCSNAA